MNEDQQGALVTSTKESLILKLLLLESTTNALQEELRNLTEKTSAEIEDLLKSPCKSHAQDGAKLLRDLDSKCSLIQQLIELFHDLRSDPQNCEPGVAQTDSAALQRVLQSNTLRRNQSVMVPDVLKFGPMLQNVLLANSITKAVQLIGATLSFQQIQILLASEKEVSDLPVHDSTFEAEDERKLCKDFKSTKSTAIPLGISQDSEFVPDNIQSNLTEDVPNNSFGQEFGNTLEILHQKQTSSQLMHFLRMNKKMSLYEFTSSKSKFPPDTTERSFMAMQQQQNYLKTAGDQKSTADTSVLARPLHSEMNTSGPVFKVKHSNGGLLTYSCVIATHTELWDIGDVFTEVKNAPPDQLLHKMVPSQKNLDDPHPHSQYFISPNGEAPASDGVLRLDKCSESQTLLDGSSRAATVLFPEFQIRKFEEIPVTITHVVNPGNFYIQHRDTKIGELSEIMAKNNCSTFAERRCIPDIGAYVMGWFPDQGQWCRAQASKICGMNGVGHPSCSNTGGFKNIEVEVKRIDFGDTSCLSLWNIKELCGEISAFPVQALNVAMAKVSPINGEDWSDEAVRWFKDKVHNRTLYARLYPEGKRVMVELYMEKGVIGAMRRGASLSVRLAQNGHAKHSQFCEGQKRSKAQDQKRKQALEWEKYLISCYSQNRR